MPPKRRGQASTSSKRVETPRTPPQNLPASHETPISKKISGATPYTSMHYKRDARMNDLGSEMKGKFAGPICPQEFLQVFLPFKAGRLQKLPRRMKEPFRRVAKQTAETAMYGPMVCSLALPLVYIHMSSPDHCTEALLSWLRSRGHP
jgi:hypothetical protein